MRIALKKYRGYIMRKINLGVVLSGALLSNAIIVTQVLARKFTWANNHENLNFGTLDSILLSREWEIQFQFLLVTGKAPEIRALSDQAPLVIDTGVQHQEQS